MLAGIPARLRMGAVLAPALLAGAPLAAQEAAERWEWAGVPALNYDADEGFGYGAILELYRHAPGAAPYRFTVQPTVFLTTGGRRDLTLFLDAPHLLPGGWRAVAYAGSERQLASPYYGLGNDVRPDPQLERDPENPDFYRFGRTRTQLTADLHRPLGGSPLRLLLGAGLSRTRVDAVPHDQGTTLVALETGAAADQEATTDAHFVRAGLVWDTRDRETGPSRGTWTELLVQRVEPALGADHGFTRWTATDRRYLTVGSPRLVFANRLLLQQVHGDAPFHELHQVQSSHRPLEGLGGAKTIRGLPKNRLAGKGAFLWNAELRWHAADFRALGKPTRLVLTGFSDAGRVWADGVRLGELADDLHHGYGAGARAGLGEHFVVALDVGHSAEAAAPFYIGLGYLF